MAQLILIIGIPNVACNGGEAGNQSGGHSKEFMYILRQTATHICSKMDRYYHAQRPLGHQNIELLPEPYFHVVLLYPIVLILWRYINPK
jgi:hypothetical protein